MKRWQSCILLFSALLLTACDGDQSMFRPAGSEADKVVFLYWTMVIGFAFVFFLVMGLVLIAFAGPSQWRVWLQSEKQIIGLGLVFPVIVLSGLLVWGYLLLGSSSLANGKPDLKIRVEGAQWWWRVTYLLEDGARVETANEVRIPVGKLIELELVSADVLHSFWVPAWTGKMDMIPGHTNILRFVVDTPGTVKGQCAEYCGGAHAFMSLYGVAIDEQTFESWLEAESAPAVPLSQHPGRQVYLSTGCGACHQVRGQIGPGGSGPDLTHVGSRLSLGAGILPNDTEAFERWMARHPFIKPGNRMPAFGFLSDLERRQLARYLDALE